MKDLVSIVIIAYNTAQYIEECLESVINQTYKKLEIIVVNDGSKDDTAKIVEQFAKKDKRIKFIDRKENKGTMYTRKEGYKNSTGEYIMFVDSDDLLELNAIEIMYNTIIEKNTDIVRCDFSTLKNGIKKSNRNYDKQYNYIKKEFEPHFYDYLFKTIKLNYMWGTLIKKELLKDIDKVEPSMIYGEDLVNNLYLFANANSITLLDKCLYIYRYTSTSITNTINEEKVLRKLNDSIKAYKKMFNFVDIYKIKDKTKYKAYSVDKLKWYSTSFIITLCQNKKYKQIKKLIEEITINNNLEEIFESTDKKYTIEGNKPLRLAINMLSNKRYLIFYLYSKYVYLPLKKIKRSI